uniref:hypothetical protein n=1 Tax=Gelidibacter sp. TaxID=2018083 RepID=UPI00404AA662
MQKHIPTNNRKQFYKDLIICLMIIALPLLFYLFHLVPAKPVWETKYFTFIDTHTQTAQIFFWLLFIKLLLLGLLCIWFFTCRHWWRYSILVPIIIELYKVLVFLDDENRYVDEYEFIYSLPYTIPIIILLIFISNKFGYYKKSLNLNQKLTEEIDTIFSELNSVKKDNLLISQNEYKALLSIKKDISKEEYLNQLILLRNNLTK